MRTQIICLRDLQKKLRNRIEPDETIELKINQKQGKI